MILILCCNAAMDRTYRVPNFRPGKFHHTSDFQVVAGGKGVNVARALSILGHKSTVTGFAGGMVGRFIVAELHRLKIRPAFVETAEESRLVQNFIDPVAHTETRVDELGPLASPRELRRLERRWKKLLAEAQIAIIAGSTPRGSPDTLYRDLVTAAKQAGVPVIVDAHDALLAQSIAAAPTIITPNLAELQALAGRQLTVPQGVQQGAGELIQQGIELVLTSLGNVGAIAVAPSGCWLVEAPEVQVVSSVGSGDAMVAGLVAATVEGLPLTEQLKWAVAAGTANAAVFGMGLPARSSVEDLLADTALTPLD